MTKLESQLSLSTELAPSVTYNALTMKRKNMLSLGIVLIAGHSGGAKCKTY